MTTPEPTNPEPSESSEAGVDAASQETATRIARAPLPTARTLRKRQAIPTQLYKAGQFSLRILKVARSGH
ncbi:MAG TPA: hypothetical protein PKX56_04070 [Marmoricola sp.]|nr:hypothetical protein [Marmoricola sp.]HNI69996.1 hypothetical protein [Marmoricola sp.]HNJ78512.1 hypothetical protein [Marmoricola sp.]HNN47581.1 hypothetical protein [Marmoricola sp.]HNO39037.1 hypothetical protein [Marmoricola sp.]